MNRIILNDNIILLVRTMKTKILFIMAILLSASCINAKTLVVYYSFTNNVHTIVNNLRTQIDADVIRIEPAEKGIDYTTITSSISAVGSDGEEEVIARYNMGGQRIAAEQQIVGISITQYRKAGKTYSKKSIVK